MKRVLLCLTFSMLAVFSSMAQSRTVSGTVTSEDEPNGIPGVNVSVKGSLVGTVSDIDGTYSLSIPEGSNVLSFSFVGFLTQERMIDNQSKIDVLLKPDVKTLGEVVVVGYGTQSAKMSVQSISSLDNSQIERMPIFTAQEALQGQAAGVQLTGTSGVGGAQQNIRIRGVASLTAGGSPLFVVDGVPLNDGSSGDYANESGAVTLNPLMELNPNEIQSISVLKDASAVAIYGSRGANGVILIQTKRGKVVNRKSMWTFTGEYKTQLL
ncbi:carboxypeptidase-like regulatory domain-containing protein [Cyclobacterium qasimii]|nr:carboxypeptidase-like regulatory domain-containing protein [Cyclobacterium qasimii]